ncbi:hypothetical protein WJX74_010043 [Apatococcus lobatus]|uniref:Polycomb protein VEFS-Box domain-containing protein n=1 Tax=Apatococcus lobatus TaxID=904363 RepID=A0AAW1RB25_9CHLO
MVSRTTAEEDGREDAKDSCRQDPRPIPMSARAIDHKGLESFAAYVKPVEQCNVLTQRAKQQPIFLKRTLSYAHRYKFNRPKAAERLSVTLELQDLGDLVADTEPNALTGTKPKRLSVFVAACAGQPLQKLDPIATSLVHLRLNVGSAKRRVRTSLDIPSGGSDADFPSGILVMIWSEFRDLSPLHGTACRRITPGVGETGVFGLLPPSAKVAWGWTRLPHGPAPQSKDCQLQLRATSMIAVPAEPSSLAAAGQAGSLKPARSSLTFTGSLPGRYPRLGVVVERSCPAKSPGKIPRRPLGQLSPSSHGPVQNRRGSPPAKGVLYFRFWFACGLKHVCQRTTGNTCPLCSLQASSVKGLCNHMEATHPDFVAAFPRDHPDVPPIVNVELATRPAPFSDMWGRLLAEDAPRWSPISRMMYHCSEAYTAIARETRPAMRRKLLRQPQGATLEDWRDAQAACSIPAAFSHHLHRTDASSQHEAQPLPSSAIGVPSSSAAVPGVGSAPSTGTQGQNSSPAPFEVGSMHALPSMRLSKSPIGGQRESINAATGPGGEEVTSPTYQTAPAAFHRPQPKLVMVRRSSKPSTLLHSKDRELLDAQISKKTKKPLKAPRREQPPRRPPRPSSAAGSAQGEPPGLDDSQELPADILRKNVPVVVVRKPPPCKSRNELERPRKKVRTEPAPGRSVVAHPSSDMQRFYHARSCTQMTEQEACAAFADPRGEPDSDNEEDMTAWEARMTRRVAAAPGLSEPDRELAVLWNVYTRQNPIHADSQVPKACSSFARKQAAAGKLAPGSPLWCSFRLHLLNLLEYHLLEPLDLDHCLVIAAADPADLTAVSSPEIVQKVNGHRQQSAVKQPDEATKILGSSPVMQHTGSFSAPASGAQSAAAAQMTASKHLKA